MSCRYSIRLLNSTGRSGSGAGNPAGKSVTTLSELTVANVKREDSARYVCFAGNRHGESQGAMWLYVQGRPQLPAAFKFETLAKIDECVIPHTKKMFFSVYYYYLHRTTGCSSQLACACEIIQVCETRLDPYTNWEQSVDPIFNTV